MINTPFFVFKQALSKDFCKFVLSENNWSQTDKAEVDAETGSVKNEQARITNLIWADLLSPIGCVLQTYIVEANKIWNYDLHRLEKIQMSQYETGGFYDWHMDSKAPINNEQRKLSIVALLNDEFKGGELELATNQSENVLKSQGDIVVFPSFLNHRVNPVTDGIRYTAVSWAYGPTFR